ncbi:MAG: hypothetical protein IBX36_05765 [Dehalococcoidia bacterium]|nr:hypothetical protein [Dehalococcoidia bacterium]
MGSRNYRWRETKKTKKVAKKSSGTAILQPPATVDVIKKGKKEKREE